MGWNGGVSLAVWMGGVAVELDEARRAKPKGAQVSGAKTTGELYGAVCRAFRRELVIDILAGASAGGLNGAFLAGVIAHDKELLPGFIRSRWLDIGDFGTLLQPLEEKQPASVMQGELFLRRLKDAFHDLIGDDAPEGDGEVPVLLDVQVTNVLGDERCFIDDWGQSFYAIEYRAPVKFREWGHYKGPLLATAARASASFPGAFESQEIPCELAMLAGLGPRTRWAIDGGLLENAPIRPAIELIPYRQASGPVRRFVCYVNAAPTAHREIDQSPQRPTLGKVIGYAINLPRDGRVVDQLQALDDATRRTGLTADAGLRLLGIGRAGLRETATRLLPTYQVRRALLSLEDVLGGGADSSGPGLARSTLTRLTEHAGAERGDLAAGAALLPWIPVSVDPPATPAEWRWGVRAGQRVIQLQLDVLRALLLSPSTRPDDAKAIFAARKALDEALVLLEPTRREFSNPDGGVAKAARTFRRAVDAADRAKALAALGPPTHGAAIEVGEHLRACTSLFYATLRRLGDGALATAKLPSRKELFGSTPGELDDAAYAAFLSLALPVEVVRRSFADDFDIETAQALHVAQLTPLVPAPLFARDGSGAKGLGPRTTQEKLAGVRLNHFAGFYRRSWRENDFMWGRFDGATVIARLLIDPARAQARAANGQHPWAELAEALVPTGPSDEAAREREALLDELLPPDEEGRPLKERLTAALEDDLTNEKRDGELARAVVARALQYTILDEEIPFLLDAVTDDLAAGGYRCELDWPRSASRMKVIKELRGPYGVDGKEPLPLPERLGAGDASEATSQLALRTVSHAVLVALAALTGVVPLARWLHPARVPFLAIRGATALRRADRAAVVLAFTGAAWFVAARLLTLPEPPRTVEVPLDTIWSAEFLAYLVCILAVLAIVTIPAIRTIRGGQNVPRRLFQGAYALGFLVAGGAVLFVYELTRRDFEQVLTTWNAAPIAPKWLLISVATAGALQVASSFGWVLQLIGFLHKPIRNRVSLTSILLGLIAAVLAYYCVRKGFVPTWDDGTWEKVGIVLAGLAPILAFGYLRLWAGEPKRATSPPPDRR
jgi:patatin-related protein